jgi:hypothetical protein
MKMKMKRSKERESFIGFGFHQGNQAGFSSLSKEIKIQ